MRRLFFFQIRRRRSSAETRFVSRKWYVRYKRVPRPFSTRGLQTLGFPRIFPRRRWESNEVVTPLDDRGSSPPERVLRKQSETGGPWSALVERARPAGRRRRSGSAVRSRHPPRSACHRTRKGRSPSRSLQGLQIALGKTDHLVRHCAFPCLGRGDPCMIWLAYLHPRPHPADPPAIHRKTAASSPAQCVLDLPVLVHPAPNRDAPRRAARIRQACRRARRVSGLRPESARRSAAPDARRISSESAMVTKSPSLECREACPWALSKGRSTISVIEGLFRPWRDGSWILMTNGLPLGMSKAGRDRRKA